MTQLKTITLGELKTQLNWLRDLPDETEIYFGAGDLAFVRARTRRYAPDEKTPELINIEFGQIYSVTLDPDEDESR